MKHLYEELKERGIDPGKLALELAYSVPVDVETDKTIGSQVITYRPVETERN